MIVKYFRQNMEFILSPGC